MSDLTVDLPDGWHPILDSNGERVRFGLYMSPPKNRYDYFHFAYVIGGKVAGIGGHMDFEYFGKFVGLGLVADGPLNGANVNYRNYMQSCFLNYFPEAKVIERLKLLVESTCDWSELELE